MTTATGPVAAALPALPAVLAVTVLAVTALAVAGLLAAVRRGRTRPGPTRPGTGHSASERPGTEHSALERPDSEHRGPVHPASERLSPDHVTPTCPTSAHSAPEHGGPEHPTSEHPGSEHPPLEYPAAAHPAPARSASAPPDSSDSGAPGHPESLTAVLEPEAEEYLAWLADYHWPADEYLELEEHWRHELDPSGTPDPAEIPLCPQCRLRREDVWPCPHCGRLLHSSCGHGMRRRRVERPYQTWMTDSEAVVAEWLCTGCASVVGLDVGHDDEPGGGLLR
ncbi:hypothetical protein ACIBF1_14380 [Spirillospora sp. NPDC050679]